jgi:hypothetical protein
MGDDPKNILRLRYRVEVGEFPIEKCRAERAQGWGATDQLVLVTTRRGPKGARSVVATGLDGDTGMEPAPAEFLGAMSAIALKLATHPETSRGVKAFCAYILDVVRLSGGDFEAPVEEL